MPQAKVVGKRLGYKATEHPANIAAWFKMRTGDFPAEIIYPSNHPPQITSQERKKLRQTFGVKIRVDDKPSPLALAGPVKG